MKVTQLTMLETEVRLLWAFCADLLTDTEKPFPSQPARPWLASSMQSSLIAGAPVSPPACTDGGA